MNQTVRWPEKRRRKPRPINPHYEVVIHMLKADDRLITRTITMMFMIIKIKTSDRKIMILRKQVNERL